MITLPKIKRDPKKTEGLCKSPWLLLDNGKYYGKWIPAAKMHKQSSCRPLCKSRRREWKGHTLKTSEELLLERKPIPECVRRRPKEVYPNSPCPLLGRNKHVVINQRKAKAVRLCQAPLDVTVETPYLDYLAEAIRIGALPLPERVRCTFCSCRSCCPCEHGYVPHDAERAGRRRAHMREFDARVRRPSTTEMRIMYD